MSTLSVKQFTTAVNGTTAATATFTTPSTAGNTLIARVSYGSYSGALLTTPTGGWIKVYDAAAPGNCNAVFIKQSTGDSAVTISYVAPNPYGLTVWLGELLNFGAFCDAFSVGGIAPTIVVPPGNGAGLAFADFCGNFSTGGHHSVGWSETFLDTGTNYNQGDFQSIAFTNTGGSFTANGGSNLANSINYFAVSSSVTASAQVYQSMIEALRTGTPNTQVYQSMMEALRTGRPVTQVFEYFLEVLTPNNVARHRTTIEEWFSG